MFILLLNNMKSAKIEYCDEVCWAETREALEELLQREKVPTYVDEYYGKRFSKTYRKDGPLEWYNKPSGFLNGIVEVTVEKMMNHPKYLGAPQEEVRNLCEAIIALLKKKLPMYVPETSTPALQGG